MTIDDIQIYDDTIKVEIGDPILTVMCYLLEIDGNAKHCQERLLNSFPLNIHDHRVRIENMCNNISIYIISYNIYIYFALPGEYLKFYLLHKSK